MKNHWLAVRTMRTLKVIDLEDDLRPEYNLSELKPVPWEKSLAFRRAKAKCDATRMKKSKIVNLHKKAVIKDIMKSMEEAAPRKWGNVSDMSCPSFNKIPYIGSMAFVMAKEMGYENFNKEIFEVINDCASYVNCKIELRAMTGMIPMMIESRLLTHINKR